MDIKKFFVKIGRAFSSTIKRIPPKDNLELKLVISVAFIFIFVIVLLFNLISNNKKIQKLSLNTKSNTSVVSEITTQPEEKQKITTVEKQNINFKMPEKLDFKNVIEAETANVFGDIVIDNVVPGFSGDGYITGFKKDTKAEYLVDIPSAQHYSFSLCLACDSETEVELTINGKKIYNYSVETSTDKKYITISRYGVFLEKGQVLLSVKTLNNDFLLDYIQVSNDVLVYQVNYNIKGELSNKKSSDRTKKLMRFISQNYGKKTISGQYVSNEKNEEIEAIYNATGRKPVIRFGDLGSYSLNGRMFSREIEAAENWAENNGVVGFIWHWKAPLYEAEVYAEKTRFDLSKAYTTKKIALLPIEDIEKLYSEKKISQECLAIIKDIDNISNELKKLQEKDIPVLWRPLHEASGNWFWWGDAGEKNYKWLWELLYNRQVNYHKLNNLIWVWSAQGSQYYIDESMFDIAAIDVYEDGDKDTSYIEQFQWLYSLTNGNKIIALSECGKLPNINLIFRDNAVWSFFGLWYGMYELKDLNYTEKDLEKVKNVYNSDGVLTLDDYISYNE